jgi:hypothetical protein
VCQYQLVGEFGVDPHFSGDPEVNPGQFVGGAVSAKVHHLPKDLVLTGSDNSKIYPDDCATLHPIPSTCANIVTNWEGDLTELVECGSLDTSGCNLRGDVPIGNADISWKLKPTFQKK